MQTITVLYFALSIPNVILLTQFGTKKKNNKFKAVPIKSKNSQNTTFSYLSYVDKNTKSGPLNFFNLNLVYNSVDSFLIFNSVCDLVCVWYMLSIQKITKKNDCD